MAYAPPPGPPVVATGAPIPMCAVCNHPHRDGEVCKTCGHVGKTDQESYAAQQAAVRGPTEKSLHFVAHDKTTLAEKKFKGHLMLAYILRKQVFVEELKQPPEFFELTEQDPHWRHVFAQKGDAPLGYVRWNVNSSPTSRLPVLGVVDMLCVLPRARRQSYAKRLLGYCIQDIAGRIPDATEFTGVWAKVPTAPAYIMHTFGRMGFRPLSATASLPPGLPPIVSHTSPPSHVWMVCTTPVMKHVVDEMNKHAAKTAAMAAGGHPPAAPGASAGAGAGMG